MRNKHTIETTMDYKCPFANCGKTFRREITIVYVTNQRGDVIDYLVR